jgi:short-subunit dehydrogenase
MRFRYSASETGENIRGRIRLMGKAVVLGASSGIGRAFAERLISEGWSVGTGSRRTELLEELRKAAPDRVFTESIDVRESGAEEALLGLIGKLGGMDLLFYAPGVGHQNPDLDPEIELSTVETNALGFTRIIGAAYRYMAGHGGGHIAAVSSIAGFRGLSPAPAYSATKALQHNYIEALSQLSHARDAGVTFTEIRPGFIDTALIAGSSYPMTMSLPYASERIYRAVMKHRPEAVIDWRWHIVVCLMRLVPGSIWRRLRLPGA